MSESKTSKLSKKAADSVVLKPKAKKVPKANPKRPEGKSKSKAKAKAKPKASPNKAPAQDKSILD
eukprot:14568103-Alexandrium_andersonii.AAC.1